MTVSETLRSNFSAPFYADIEASPEHKHCVLDLQSKQASVGLLPTRESSEWSKSVKGHLIELNFFCIKTVIEQRRILHAINETKKLISSARERSNAEPKRIEKTNNIPRKNYYIRKHCDLEGDPHRISYKRTRHEAWDNEDMLQKGLAELELDCTKINNLLIAIKKEQKQIHSME